MDNEIQMDPAKRPWVYDCSGNKVVKTETGEPDYTTIWVEEEKADETYS
jgi:hypothetical protein